MQASRESLAQVIETLIDLLDILDGEADLEDDGCTEGETDQDEVPTGLNVTIRPDRAA